MLEERIEAKRVQRIVAERETFCFFRRPHVELQANFISFVPFGNFRLLRRCGSSFLVAIIVFLMSVINDKNTSLQFG